MMVPTKTLRERLSEAIDGCFEDGRTLGEIVDDALDALEDPCLWKTADSLEPTFTLLARDPIAWRTVEFWIGLANNRGLHQNKLDEAGLCAKAMREWHEQLDPTTRRDAEGE